MGKITNLLIGLVIVSFIFTGFIYFMADSSSKTGVTFTQGNLNRSYNKLQYVNNLTNDISQESNKTIEQSSADILGSYFKQGYSAFRLTLTSLAVTNEMVSNAGTDLNINDGSGNFFKMITAIIAIMIIFGVIIYVVVGRDV